MTTETITARVLVAIYINGGLFNSGEVIEGDEAVLEPYIESGSIDADLSAVEYALNEGQKVRHLTMADEKNKESDIDVNDIIEAIKKLDPDDKTLWTSKAKPTTEAIEAELGGEVKVSAAERDVAWKAITE